MRPFAYARAGSAAEAVRAAAASQDDAPPVRARTQFLDGGTTLIDLMKLDVMQPHTLIDVRGLARENAHIRVEEDGLHLGAFVRMAVAAEHPQVCREYPAVAQSLRLAASPQLRHMASLAGNVLQRTRCTYFRDTSYAECNKRTPGSGCAALSGSNRKLAVLGVSEHCIAHYPGDFAQALAALGATVLIQGPEGERSLPLEGLHRLPGDSPHIETVLGSADLITGFFVPAGPWARRSLYLKVRDRESYEFALASAAVALDLRAGVVHEARIALGGVATKPWRAHEAEEWLHCERLDETSASAAARAAFEHAVTHGGNHFKPELGRRTLVRALLECAAMELA